MLLLINFQETSQEYSPLPFDDHNDDDFANLNPWDDDGNPYFDEGPIDWDKVTIIVDPKSGKINSAGYSDESIIQEEHSSTLVAKPGPPVTRRELFPNYLAAQGERLSSSFVGLEKTSKYYSLENGR